MAWFSDINRVKCAGRLELIWSFIVALVTGTTALATAGERFEAGPLYSDFPLTLSLGHRTEVLGPLFYSEQNDSRRTWGIPPLISRTWDPLTDSEEYDILYPAL